MKLCPFDYPFLEKPIKLLDNKEIEKIYTMIKGIHHDPDFGKIESDILLKYKLSQEFGVKPNFS